MNKKIFIESINSPESSPRGLITYKIIADQIVQDLRLSPFFNQMRIIIDIENCLFAIYTKLEVVKRPIYLKDISIISQINEESYKMVLKDENYAAYYLNALWTRLGKENVKQIDRYESEVRIPSELLLEELKNYIILDVGEKKRKEIYDVMNRIIPIGFKVRNFLNFNENEILIIASENPIEEKHVEMIKQKLKMKPELLDEKLINKYIQKPQEDSMDRFKPWKNGIDKINGGV